MYKDGETFLPFSLEKRPDLAPDLSPSLRDIYWAAGVFEGEGHACRRGGTTAFATVSQRQLWLCAKLRSSFGGSVSRYWPTTSEGKRRRYHVWSLSGIRARGFLLTIYSLLSPRRQQQVRKACLSKSRGHSNNDDFRRASVADRYRNIRQRWAVGDLTQEELAKQFGMTRSGVRYALGLNKRAREREARDKSRKFAQHRIL